VIFFGATAPAAVGVYMEPPVAAPSVEVHAEDES
jgi:hypothetical protein